MYVKHESYHGSAIEAPVIKVILDIRIRVLLLTLVKFLIVGRLVVGEN